MTKNKRPAAVATARRARVGSLTGSPIHKKQRRYNHPAVLTNDDASDADRDWFAAHPDRNYHLRPIAACELARDEQRRPDDSDLVAYTIVKQFRPGLRLRVYFRAPPFHRIESFPDAACETIWLVVEKQYQQMPAVIDALSDGGSL